MKYALLAYCISLAAIVPAKAQASKHDFLDQVSQFRAECSHPFTGGAMVTTRNKIVSMMNQQIDYVTGKCNDKMLNAQCDEQRRQKISNPGACNQLQQYNTTLTTEKGARDAVKSVGDADVPNKTDFLLRQFNSFGNTMQN